MKKIFFVVLFLHFISSAKSNDENYLHLDFVILENGECTGEIDSFFYYNKVSCSYVKVKEYVHHYGGVDILAEDYEHIVHSDTIMFFIKYRDEDNGVNWSEPIKVQNKPYASFCVELKGTLRKKKRKRMYFLKKTSKWVVLKLVPQR